jgi:hypothetical protein
METVFSTEPSVQGVKDSLARLIEQRDEIDEIITELKDELEEMEWLL